MPIQESVPDEPHQQRIEERAAPRPETGSRGADPSEADHRTTRPAPTTPGSRLGPAAGVETSGAEGQPPAAPPPDAAAPRPPEPRHRGPSDGAGRVLDDREAAWFSPPTHGNRVAGTRTTGGFDNHAGRPDPDHLRIVDGRPLEEAPGPGVGRDDPRAGFPADLQPDEDRGAHT